MKPIYSFVIRIYRRDADAIAGVIEDVRTSRTAAFTSIADLWIVLSGKRRMPRRQARIPMTEPPTVLPPRSSGSRRS